MCGITGIYAFGREAPPVDRGLLRRMTRVLAHRGPDGEGCWISEDKRVGLGHRRLAIIDLSDAASQPMSNADGSLWLTYNGEIYNHAEIREELERVGDYVWKTDHSDAEVIIHAFHRWGIECVHRFRGMFAFAMWDARKRELWLVRDRIGVKPVYYAKRQGQIAFASEIKALLEDDTQARELDEDAFFDYLSFRAVPAPRTMFKGIEKLENGSWLRIDAAGAVQERKYWDVLDHITPLGGASEGEIAERLFGELQTAVRLRKVSDVPVGVFLSGGIDSSANVMLFSEGESRPVKTFSIGYEGDYSSFENELHYARRVAATYGADYHERRLTQEDLLEFLPRMVHLQDEPIGDPVCVPVYYVSKLARDNGVTVCHVGEGADELFCGYPSWKRNLAVQKAANLPVPAASKKLLLALLRGLGKKERYYYELLRRDIAGRPVHWGGGEAFPDEVKRLVLSPRMRQRYHDRSSWEALDPIHRRFRQKSPDHGALAWMTYLDLSFRLPELLLMRVDKMSMGVGLECRVPFLDHKVVELAMGIPESVKTRGGNLKHILKKAMRGRLDDDIVDRKKQGFGVPINDWYLNRLGDETLRVVREFSRETDLLDMDAVSRLMSGRNRDLAWCLLNAALWWKSFIAAPKTTAAG